MTHQVTSPVVVAIPKVCSRCDGPFRTVAEGTRVCPDCRTADTNRPRSLVKTKASHLSARQLQMIHLLGEGKQYKQMAYEMHLTVGTLKVYFANLYTRLDFLPQQRDHVNLLLWSIRHGYLPANPEIPASVAEHNAPVRMTAELPQSDFAAVNVNHRNAETAIMHSRMDRCEDLLKVLAGKLNLNISPLLN